jgi:hypothetical protein
MMKTLLLLLTGAIKITRSDENHDQPMAILKEQDEKKKMTQSAIFQLCKCQVVFTHKFPFFHTYNFAIQNWNCELLAVQTVFAREIVGTFSFSDVYLLFLNMYRWLVAN